jgi:hypothetical protein
VLDVLTHARAEPFTTKSDFARKAANAVALAASEGLITTRLNDTTYTNRWMVTIDGLEWMEGVNDVLGD